MDIKPIKTEEEYEAVLAEIRRLWDTAEPNTPEGDRFEVLTLLVKAYEDEHYAIPAPDPVEFIKHQMENRRLSRADLEPYLGSRARVTEFLSRKRPLSLSMIRKLNEGLGIPAD